MRRIAWGCALVAVMASTVAPAGAAGATPWPLGTFTIVPGPVRDCPSGFVCSRFELSNCPNVAATAEAEIAVATPSGPPRGTVVLLSGGTAQVWWGNLSSLGQRFVERLRAVDGFSVVQIRWVTPWLFASPGEDAGSGHLACRPATAIRWIHDHVYALAPPPANAASGSCGFCVTGSSGGASEAAYALSFYGLDGILDGVLPTSGPPHAAQVKGCQPGFPGYGYGPNARFIDASHGFVKPHEPGPCALQDPAWIARWAAESVDTGGNDFSHPTTRIEFVIGGKDPTSAPPHAADYRDRLEQVPGNDVTWRVVAGMPHDIQVSQDGLAVLEAALLG